MSALEGVRLKLERAEHVIDELNQAVIDYLAENPYQVVGEFERETSEYVLRGEVTKPTVVIVQDATSFTNVSWFSDGPMDGAVLVRMTLEGPGPNPKVKMEGEIPVTVTFDDPALTEGQPGLISLLKAILTGVREVVSAFEADL